VVAVRSVAVVGGQALTVPLPLRSGERGQHARREREGPACEHSV